ncbi:hypothetical protein EVA_18154, partial [gut metagenome]
MSNIAIPEVNVVSPKQDTTQEIEITAIDNSIKVANAPVGS